MDETTIRLKPDDSPAEEAAGSLALVEVIVPRRVRSQLVAIDGGLLDVLDTIEELFRHVPGDQGRRLLRRAYSRLEALHGDAQRALSAVERG